MTQLLKHWRSATRQQRCTGANWYRAAHQLICTLASEHRCSKARVAGVLAATSPRLHWSRNVAVSKVLLSGGAPTGVFGANVRKARAILAGAKPLCVLRGMKVRSFYRALLGDGSAAVVDVWMLRACGLAPDVRLDRGGLYERVVKALRTLAERLRVTVTNLQATIWVVVRGSAV